MYIQGEKRAVYGMGNTGKKIALRYVHLDEENQGFNEIFVDKKGKIRNKNEQIKTNALECLGFFAGWCWLHRMAGQ